MDVAASSDLSGSNLALKSLRAGNEPVTLDVIEDDREPGLLQPALAFPCTTASLARRISSLTAAGESMERLKHDLWRTPH